MALQPPSPEGIPLRERDRSQRTDMEKPEPGLEGELLACLAQ